MASGNDDWQTPPELFEPALRMLDSSKFKLDPFYGEGSPVPAHNWYRADQYDAFEMRWRSALSRDPQDAWVNGPWSQQRKVVEKCIDEAVLGMEIFLVQPVTGASYLGHILRAPARCYPFKRPQFLKDGKRVASSNRTDVVLVYWGTRPWAFREVYRELGEVDR